MTSRLFIVHGYKAHPQSHWFQWLCHQFPELHSHIVALPDSDHPDVNPWVKTLQTVIGHVDEHTYMVAHSLGCITTLKFLETLLPTQRLGGLLLVAGFAETLPNLPQLDAFNQVTPNWSVLQKHIVNKQVLLSEDDAEVSAAATQRLSEAWQAPLGRLQHRGHFTQADGCDTLPEAAYWLENVLTHSRPLHNNDIGQVGAGADAATIKD